jgi:hypothetical protein
VTSATAPSSAPTAPTISATIARVELPPPPPNELLASIVGAGVSELSGPVQSTTEPSEYVCLTPNVYVLLESVRPRKENAASSSVGTLPPLHEIFVMTASSPSPLF